MAIITVLKCPVGAIEGRPIEAILTMPITLLLMCLSIPEEDRGELVRKHVGTRLEIWSQMGVVVEFIVGISNQNVHQSASRVDRANTS